MSAPRTQNETGWDKESAVRTFSKSMQMMELCITETHKFFENWSSEMTEDVQETWDELKELVQKLQFLVAKEPKSVFRQQFDAVRHLVVLTTRLQALVGGNPAEMVRLAGNLASLNEKTLKMQVAIEKEYGDLSEKDSNRSILEELTSDQVATVFQWVEENRALERALGE